MCDSPSSSASSRAASWAASRVPMRAVPLKAMCSSRCARPDDVNGIKVSLSLQMQTQQHYSRHAHLFCRPPRQRRRHLRRCGS